MPQLNSLQPRQPTTGNVDLLLPLQPKLLVPLGKDDTYRFLVLASTVAADDLKTQHLGHCQLSVADGVLEHTFYRICMRFLSFFSGASCSDDNTRVSAHRAVRSIPSLTDCPHYLSF